MLDVNARRLMSSTRTRVVQNKVLSTFTPQDFDLLRPHLETVQLRRRDIIHEANKPSDAVYFVESGVLSRVARTVADGPVEVAIVGRFGFVGVAVVLGTMISANRTIVLIPGTALRISAERLTEVMTARVSIRDHLLRYVQMLMSQKAQVSLCNTKHGIESRLARWLLLAYDRVTGGEVPVTHDVLSMVLGVRRAGVTDAIAGFEADGIVAKERGLIRILDRDGLRSKACECYDIIDERSSWQREMPEYQHLIDAPPYRPD
jgi:CRP-like cAMP-binding protein